jgi:hypothetical protein
MIQIDFIHGSKYVSLWREERMPGALVLIVAKSVLANRGIDLIQLPPSSKAKRDLWI